MISVSTATEAATAIRQYMAEFGGLSTGWYVGIAANPRKRLFQDHGVQEQGGDPWIFRNCANHNDARAVEQYFLRLGTDGGSGGGDIMSKSVYAYKKAPHTRE